MSDTASLMDTGELRHRVKIETKTELDTEDTRGKPEISWEAAPAIWVWAKVETLSGRKLEFARQLVATASHLVTIRYRPVDVKANRLVFKGAVLNIGHANDVENRGVKLELTCTEEK